MRKDFPRLDLKDAQVILLEAGPSLIAAYPDELREATLKLLRNKNVDIQLNTKMQDFNGQRVTLGDGSTIETQTLIWTAGAKAAARWRSVRAAAAVVRRGAPAALRGGGRQARRGEALVTAPHPERQYLDLLRRIFEEGIDRDDRTGTILFMGAIVAPDA